MQINEMIVKLRATVFVPSGVILRDAALPQLRGTGRSQLDDRVEARGRLNDASPLEVRNCTVENILWVLSRGLSCDGPREQR